jgi:hypothetical protein
LLALEELVVVGFPCHYCPGWVEEVDVLLGGVTMTMRTAAHVCTIVTYHVFDGGVCLATRLGSVAGCTGLLVLDAQTMGPAIAVRCAVDDASLGMKQHKQALEADCQVS